MGAFGSLPYRSAAKWDWGNHKGLPLRINDRRDNPLWLPPIRYGCPQSVMVALVDYFLRVALGTNHFGHIMIF